MAAGTFRKASPATTAGTAVLIIEKWCLFNVHINANVQFSFCLDSTRLGGPFRCKGPSGSLAVVILPLGLYSWMGGWMDGLMYRILHCWYIWVKGLQIMSTQIEKLKQ